MRLALAIAGVLMASGLVGCGGSPAPAAASSTKAKSTTVAATAAPGDQPAVARAPKSVFSTNNPRDPFYPKTQPDKPSEKTTTVAKAFVPDDFKSALESGFQGIYGTADERVALVHGMILEAGREAVVPVTMSGQPKSLRVTVLRVLRTAVEVKVDGLAQVLTLTKPTR